MRNFASTDSTTVPSTIEASLEAPDPNEMLAMSVLPRHDSIGVQLDKGTTQICINVKAADIEDEDRAPVDIVVALDISGSMLSNGKLEDCKRTLTFMVRTLKSSDRFGLITFSTRATTVFPALSMTPENKEMALRKIEAIRATGQTNLSGGLALAAQELNFLQQPNNVQALFLLTDGHANMGITRTTDLQAMIQSFTAMGEPRQVKNGMMNLSMDDVSTDGISVNTKPSTIEIPKRDSKLSLICFGYGSDHNSDMLSAIAKETQGGGYYFIEHGTDSNVASAFGDAMGGVLSVVAQSAIVRISLPPAADEKGIKIVKVYHDEAIARGDGVYTVSINDFYAEETRDVIFEIKLSETASEAPLPHALVTLSYFDAINGKNCTVGPMSCRIARPDSDELSTVNDHVEEQFVRIQAVEDMKEAKREAEAGNYAAAQTRLRGCARRMKANTNLKEAYVADMVGDVEAVTRGIGNSSAYTTAGRHTMTNTMMSHGYQRTMRSAAPRDKGSAAPSAMSRYATSKKKARASAYQSGTI